MKKIIDGRVEWVEEYNRQGQSIGKTFPRIRPNFVELTSEHFNGGSGDTAKLYDVAKFIESLYDKWVTAKNF
jgi:hypothetical protein